MMRRYASNVSEKLYPKILFYNIVYRRDDNSLQIQRFCVKARVLTREYHGEVTFRTRKRLSILRLSLSPSLSLPSILRHRSAMRRNRSADNFAPLVFKRPRRASIKFHDRGPACQRARFE